jgi:peptidoglycan-N-acetylglucosamine deacetylase
MRERKDKNRLVKGTFLFSSVIGLLGAGLLIFYYFGAKAEANEPSKQQNISTDLPLKPTAGTTALLTRDFNLEKNYLIQREQNKAVLWDRKKVDEKTINVKETNYKPTNNHTTPDKTATEHKGTPQPPKNDINVQKSDQNKVLPVNSGKRTVYLTFDDGPENFSGDILALLEKYHFKATFFMLDGNIKRYPDAVKQMVKLGEGVGLHGVTHDVKKFYASEKSVLGEMDQDQQTLKSITGVESFLIRTPYGSAPYMTKEYKQAVANHGFLMWDWSIDSKDWYYRDARFVTSIITQLKQQSGDKHPIVILMHEQRQTLANLPKLLDYLSKQHYDCKPLDRRLAPYHF